jgi:methylenetetrahydrofolate dehydrogenase (NADP+)/methenyltetrahydrofolate cyclohydrolase
VTEILGGKELSASIRSQVAAAAEELRSEGTVPTVVIVVVTDDEGTLSYVRSLVRAAASTGIEAEVVSLPAEASEAEVVAALTKAAGDPRVHGILLQTPLPGGMSTAEVALHIPPAKDVDGANPLSLGLLTAGLPSFAPATAVAVMELLAHHSIRLAGRSVAVVGRSTVVGKPLAQLLLAANATVTICHSKTSELDEVTSSADVVIAAAGSPHLIGEDHVSDTAVVIDVGTNVDADGKLLGDVDGDAIEGIAAARSPVPGGVGPVTTGVLLRHVVEAAQRSGTFARNGQ